MPVYLLPTLASGTLGILLRYSESCLPQLRVDGNLASQAWPRECDRAQHSLTFNGQEPANHRTGCDFAPLEADGHLEGLCAECWIHIAAHAAPSSTLPQQASSTGRFERKQQ